MFGYFRAVRTPNRSRSFEPIILTESDKFINPDNVELPHDTITSKSELYEWLSKNNIDTFIVYDYFGRGQIDVYSELRCWWIKNSKISGYNIGTETDFKGFEIIFDNLKALTRERPKETYTISHSASESVIINLDSSIVCSTDYLNYSNCKYRDSLASYLSSTCERLTRITSGNKSKDSYYILRRNNYIDVN